jgi:hypothetical protein
VGKRRARHWAAITSPFSDDRKVTEVEPIDVWASPALHSVLAAIAIVNDDALHEVGPGSDSCNATLWQSQLVACAGSLMSGGQGY